MSQSVNNDQKPWNLHQKVYLVGFGDKKISLLYSYQSSKNQVQNQITCLS